MNNEQDNRPPSTKEEIEAAVARCYGKTTDDGSIAAAMANIPGIPSSSPRTVKQQVPSPQPPATPKQVNVVDDTKKPTTKKKSSSSSNKKNGDLDTFAEKCESLDINAAICNAESKKNEDANVIDFLKSINKKIFDETQAGGFSTNICFRVTNENWVNINHIMDWYKSRGFEILNYNMTTPPYGTSGMMQHDFTISWAIA